MGGKIRKTPMALPLLLIAAAWLLSACGSVAMADSLPDADQMTINVVATTGMVGDVVKNVGGEYVSVTVLMGPGVDPHLYKTSAGDVSRLQKADIIFYSGLHLEAAMGVVLERMGTLKTTVAITDSLDRDALIAPPNYSSAYDPHVWFDVSLWAGTVDTVREALSRIDPAHADQYAANAAAYQAELLQLHEEILTQVQQLPPDRRVLVTAHDAFSYFGRAYGFEVVGLQGLSTATEAGAANVRDLAEMITERRIPAVFIESSVPRRNIEAVQAAVESRGFNVQIGGQLYSDAMGDPGTPEGTYTGMVRANVSTILNALAAEAKTRN